MLSTKVIDAIDYLKDYCNTKNISFSYLVKLLENHEIDSSERDLYDNYNILDEYFNGSYYIYEGYSCPC